MVPQNVTAAAVALNQLQNTMAPPVSHERPPGNPPVAYPSELRVPVVSSSSSSSSSSHLTSSSLSLAPYPSGSEQDLSDLDGIDESLVAKLDMDLQKNLQRLLRKRLQRQHGMRLRLAAASKFVSAGAIRVAAMEKQRQNVSNEIAAISNQINTLTKNRDTWMQRDAHLQGLLSRVRGEIDQKQAEKKEIAKGMTSIVERTKVEAEALKVVINLASQEDSDDESANANVVPQDLNQDLNARFMPRDLAGVTPSDLTSLNAQQLRKTHRIVSESSSDESVSSGESGEDDTSMSGVDSDEFDESAYSKPKPMKKWAAWQFRLTSKQWWRIEQSARGCKACNGRNGSIHSKSNACKRTQAYRKRLKSSIRKKINAEQRSKLQSSKRRESKKRKRGSNSSAGASAKRQRQPQARYPDGASAIRRSTRSNNSK